MCTFLIHGVHIKCLHHLSSKGMIFFFCLYKDAYEEIDAALLLAIDVNKLSEDGKLDCFFSAKGKDIGNAVLSSFS